MRTPKAITRFHSEYSFLSNFWRAPIWFDGNRYPTVEHAFQAAKTFDRETRKLIRQARTPADAKRIGRRIVLREDWEEVKVSIMRVLVREKFSSKGLAQMLLNTGDAELIEGNHWGDTFWGRCRGVGENHLGKILMEVRDEIRERSNQ